MKEKEMYLFIHKYVLKRHENDVGATTYWMLRKHSFFGYMSASELIMKGKIEMVYKHILCVIEGASSEL